MKCRDIRNELEHYADGELSTETVDAVELHLDSCPVCRSEAAAIREFRNEMNSLSRTRLSANAFSDLRSVVAAQFATAYGYPSFRLVDGGTDWTKRWMMPTAVGTFATFIFAILLLNLILIPSDVPSIAFESELNANTGDPLLLASFGQSGNDLLITPQQFASSRADFSQESPSLNPAGSLVDVARSESRDDEVVVVADVYGNGSAEITNVVESPRDRKMLDRLVAALRTDRTATPFVPATMDNRDNIVRVVLKFQNVNVNIDDSSAFR